MKLVISKSVFARLATICSNIGITSAQSIIDHETFTKEMEKRYEQHKDLYKGMSYEDFLNQQKENLITYGKSSSFVWDFMQTYSDNTKSWYTIVNEEETIEVQLNTDIVKEATDIFETTALKLIPSFINIGLTLKDAKKVAEDFSTKWGLYVPKEKKKDKKEGTLTKVETHGWTFKIDKSMPPEAIKVNGEMINCHWYIATKDDVSIDVTHHMVSNIINDKLIKQMNETYTENFMDALRSLVNSIVS